MKVYELFESISTINPSNVDDGYMVKSIKVDNKNGMGNTPQGQNVAYQGFVAEIKISDFLKLAKSADREEDAKKFEKMLKNGEAIANPFLEISFTDPDDLEKDDLNLTIKTHEGRARIKAVQLIEGDIMFPIQFVLRGGLRARHLNDLFFKKLLEEPWKSENGEFMKVKVGKIYWNGQMK